VKKSIDPNKSYNKMNPLNHHYAQKKINPKNEAKNVINPLNHFCAQNINLKNKA
jgi:hypothetical protein